MTTLLAQPAGAPGRPATTREANVPTPHHGPTVTVVRLDALMPAEMAAKTAEIGVRKAALSALTILVPGILAGAFIALGAAFATTVAAGSAGVVPCGIARLLTGLAFSLGLVLVIIGGAELFTGNSLPAMAWAARRISSRADVRNWAIDMPATLSGRSGPPC